MVTRWGLPCRVADPNIGVVSVKLGSSSEAEAPEVRRLRTGAILRWRILDFFFDQRLEETDQRLRETDQKLEDTEQKLVKKLMTIQ